MRSIATGAIGVVSLAIQLSDSAYKSRRFYIDVRNAPKESLETIAYLGRLVQQLESICREERRYPGDAPVYENLAAHLQDCGARTMESSSIVNDIYTSTTEKKAWSAVKAVVKRETSKGYNERLKLALDLSERARIVHVDGYRDHEAQESRAAVQDCTARMIPLTQDVRQTKTTIQQLPSIMAPLAQESRQILEGVQCFPELINPLIQGNQHLRTDLRGVSSSIAPLAQDTRAIMTDVRCIPGSLADLSYQNQRTYCEVYGVSNAVGTLAQRFNRIESAILRAPAFIAPLCQKTKQTHDAVQDLPKTLLPMIRDVLTAPDRGELGQRISDSGTGPGTMKRRHKPKSSRECASGSDSENLSARNDEYGIPHHGTLKAGEMQRFGHVTMTQGPGLNSKPVKFTVSYSPKNFSTRVDIHI